MLKIVILCGGNGTRLWPISREDMPKQFNKIFGTSSLFQETLLRNQKLFEISEAIFEVVSNQNYFFLLKDQAQEIQQNISSFILESCPKNTAPAITLSALNSKPDDILLVLPSDHLIKNHQEYITDVIKAIDMAKKDFLVTFGIKPLSPHTGYGYIQSSNGIVKKFIEKPDLKTAKDFLHSGNYYWNSGMFCFKAKTFLSELQHYAPEVFNSISEIFKNTPKEKDYFRLSEQQSKSIPSISIDYALMEKSKKVFCVESTFDWNDIGSFDSLSEEFIKPNSCYTNPTKTIQYESNNNFILSEKMVATIGIHDLIVIDTIDSLLLAKRGESQKVKNIIPLIKKDFPQLTQQHNITHRPWGTYSILLESKNYKIKKIVVKPNARLSLQKHFHRNEHWIVVSGTAHITLEDQNFELHTNESTYIPMGKIHRLANEGKIDLVMIEIQMGEYLGEDDIVRIEDDFKRC